MNAGLLSRLFAAKQPQQGASSPRQPAPMGMPPLPGMDPLTIEQAPGNIWAEQGAPPAGDEGFMSPNDAKWMDDEYAEGSSDFDDQMPDVKAALSHYGIEARGAPGAPGGFEWTTDDALKPMGGAAGAEGGPEGLMTPDFTDVASGGGPDDLMPMSDPSLDSAAPDRGGYAQTLEYNTSPDDLMTPGFAAGQNGDYRPQTRRLSDPALQERADQLMPYYSAATGGNASRAPLGEMFGPPAPSLTRMSSR